jgi:cell division inhibitor SepF
MALSDLWNSTLVYFGVREEDWEDEYDDDGSAAHEDLEQVYSERPNVRRLSPRRRPGSDFDDIFSEEAPRGGGPVPIRGGRNGGPVPQNGGHRTAGQVSLVVPKSFNDAQKVADKLKSDVPVIINFQSADPELAKRLVDFASGLTYALDGSMQRVADRVFLLTPASISVSAEDKALLMERGFFNQY